MSPKCYTFAHPNVKQETMDDARLSVKQIIDAIKMLTPSEYNEFASKFASLQRPEDSIDAYIEEQRFCNGRACPVCGSSNVVRNGRRKDGVQKFCCKDCNKSFVAKTSTIASGTHKSLDVWMKYIECMMNWATVRESAERCGISDRTAFLWRHKILDAMRIMMDDVTLEGIVEADEAYLPIYPIRVTTRRARASTCNEHPVREGLRYTREDCPKNSYVCRVLLTGTGTQSERRQTSVGAPPMTLTNYLEVKSRSSLFSAQTGTVFTENYHEKRDRI